MPIWSKTTVAKCDLGPISNNNTVARTVLKKFHLRQQIEVPWILLTKLTYSGKFRVARSFSQGRGNSQLRGLFCTSFTLHSENIFYLTSQFRKLNTKMVKIKISARFCFWPHKPISVNLQLRALFRTSFKVNSENILCATRLLFEIGPKSDFATVVLP